MAKEKQVCINCGYVGIAKKYIKGSVATELILYLLMILPGVIYSIWRLTTKYEGCPQCGNDTMIPANTPRGKKLIKEFNEKP